MYTPCDESSDKNVMESVSRTRGHVCKLHIWLGLSISLLATHEYNFLVPEKIVSGEPLIPEVKDFKTIIINTLLGKAEYSKILFT
jgi:hypothetical protein